MTVVIPSRDSHFTDGKEVPAGNGGMNWNNFMDIFSLRRTANLYFEIIIYPFRLSNQNSEIEEGIEYMTNKKAFQ